MKDGKRYLLLLLTAIYAFNWIDRVTLGVVQQSIENSLRLTDTQMGVLTGIAFALFYATMGVPIARWSDRGDRVFVVSITTALWSVLVALFGAAGNFVQLLLIRIGIGVGEAGCVPPAHSLIAEYFQRSERPRAVSLYVQGPQVAMVVGYLAAGWLNEAVGWRETFAIIGLPGLALAGLAAVTLREPRRRRWNSVDPVQSLSSANVRVVLKTLWASRAYRHLLICYSVWYFFGYGLLQWEPTFFIRSHGMSSRAVGSWFSLVYGVVGAAGVYLGGELASRYAARNEKLQLRGCGIALALFAVLTVGTLIAPSEYVALGSLGLAALGGNICQGPIVATIQTLIPPRMRAMSIALLLFFANLIGMGFGPLVGGALSDVLKPWLGMESLRYALLILCPGYLWAAWHAWRAGGTVEFEIEKVRAAEAIESPLLRPPAKSLRSV